MSKKLINTAGFYLLLACLPTTAALFRIYVHQDAVQLGYALAGQQKLQQRLAGRLQAMQVEVAAVRSPGRLMKVARGLGLHPPAVAQVVSGHLTQAHLARADTARARHDYR